MKEAFELRRYDSTTQSNLVVGQFTATTTTTAYEFDASQINEKENGVFQVYPSDPSKCFYLPIPSGMAWFVLIDDAELLASVEYHDQYAFFCIPSYAKKLYWVKANSREEAIAIALKR